MFGIISSIVLVVATIVLFLFKTRVTAPCSLAIVAILSSIYSVIMIRASIFFLIVPILCIVFNVFSAFYFERVYDYDKRILSLALNKGMSTKDGGRLIGRCFPYYKDQLRYNNSYIVQSDLSLKGGTIVTGSTGSGKTYSIINMIRQDIDNGKSVAFFNFKGDKDTSDKIKSLCNGQKVYELSWDDCNFSYDPLINLDDAGKAEAILNMRKWSIGGVDDHYKTGTLLFLQKTIREYEHEGGNYLRGFYNFLRTYNVRRELYDSYNTVMKLLELTITSNVGSIFSESNYEFRFDMDEQYVLIVSFTSSTKTLGTSITSLMLRDLMEVGTKNVYNPALCLYIDEFGSCESPIVVKDILEKGRSCGISTVLSMQDLNQLIINTNAPFLDSVLGTVNSYIIFQGATRQTAEKLSGVQVYDIDKLLMSLKKPINGRPPTAIYISKYPVFEKSGTEVYRFIPTRFKNSWTNSVDRVIEPDPEPIEINNHIIEEPERDDVVQVIRPEDLDHYL